MSRLPLNELEEYLAKGWINLEVLDISRVIKPGEVVTIILSDGPFDVPTELPGGAARLASTKHEFEEGGLVRMRVMERR